MGGCFCVGVATGMWMGWGAAGVGVGVADVNIGAGAGDGHSCHETIVINTALRSRKNITRTGVPIGNGALCSLRAIVPRKKNIAPKVASDITLPGTKVPLP
jgi:hypothetical protein